MRLPALLLLGRSSPKGLWWKAYRLVVVSLVSVAPMEQLCLWNYSCPRPRLKKLAVAAHARLVL